MKNYLKSIPIVSLTILFFITACNTHKVDEHIPLTLNFQTIYHLEVNDGALTEIFEGSSLSNKTNHFADYPNKNLLLISYDAFGNEQDEVIGITGTILLDENRKIHPFGKMLTDNQLKTKLVISVNNKYIESLLTGSQKLTDIKFYTSEDKKSYGKVAFKYEFSDVTFKDRLTKKFYTVSGYIVSAVADELVVNNYKNEL